MKSRLWLFQLPIILLSTAAYLSLEFASSGQIQNTFYQKHLYPGLKTFSTFFTDLKFKLRGATPPKNKIVIVEIDSPSLEAYGRWPWHRDTMAALIFEIHKLGARVIGLDIVFSEEDRRVSQELASYLTAKGLDAALPGFETDNVLVKVIEVTADHLVLGWATEGACSPLLLGLKNCPVDQKPMLKEVFPIGFDKFTITRFEAPSLGFSLEKTPLQAVITFIPNLQKFNAVAKHAGYFNAFQDPDGYIRREELLMVSEGKAFPSLALEMARAGLGEEIAVAIDNNQRVQNIRFIKSGREIPVSPLGVMQVNFRGGDRTFPYVSVMDLLSSSEKLEDPINRKLAGVSKKELLHDAYVLIGVSALGVFDMRSFPFGANIPGVEGHANILDNILSGDPLLSESHTGGRIVMLLLMTLGALAFALLTQKLESIPALLLFLFVFMGFEFIDIQILFKNNYNWNTSFFIIEIVSIFIFTLVVKYVLEERNKKFLRSAFNKYVSPTIVDSIIKDPSKLALGGERKELSILFSDIRGFTTFSEQMDAKVLTHFLNDYLGIMTKIVFLHHGTLDKYIGDAVMAFWGAPLGNPSHAVNACQAAIAMMKALEENQSRWKNEYGIDVHIGIGINTGPVSVGNMGSDTNFEYTVIGDHVNLASRLEGLTKAYGVGIVTSQFTLDSILKSGAEPPSHRILDSVKVKGKKTAVELVQILTTSYPNEGLRLWDEGRKLYRKQAWDQAIRQFEGANEILGKFLGRADSPCMEFTQRCKDYQVTPPEKDWDGSWEMHSK